MRIFISNSGAGWLCRDKTERPAIVGVKRQINLMGCQFVHTRSTTKFSNLDKAKAKIALDKSNLDVLN